ncbi:MAG: hypothetical protein FJ147_25265 [Deltaproteobacteria bacterium]|nr:hypothetical protein [Deltaproteobacteria bacterium]
MSTPLTAIVWASVLLVAAAPGCSNKEAATSTAPVSVETLAQQTAQRLLAQPEVKKALEEQSQGTSDEVLDRLARRGWKRLSDDQLFQRVELRRKLLSSTDITTCASVVRDKATSTQTHAALAKLGASDIQAFFALKETAVLAEAKDQKPPKMILQDQFPEAFGSLLKSLPPDQADHLGELLTGDPARASDEDICWAEKTFLDALLTLQEPYRSTLARAVVQ